MFFVFDGVDGSGKTTQLGRFSAWLKREAFDVVECKDPGTTELGEHLRELLLRKSETPIHMRAEMMLFTTARTQLVEQVIKPSLDAGRVVVLDRYVLSTIVYQGHAGKLDADSIRRVNEVAIDGLWPDHTFVLDVPTEVALERLGNELDRMESRGHQYLESVRQGFLSEARELPNTSVIDATRSPDEIETEIRGIAAPIVAANNEGGSR